MFDKPRKQPTPPIVAKMQEQFQELAAPLPPMAPNRPFFEQFKAQRVQIEKDLAEAIKRVDDLTIILQSYRREEMLLSMNPEMDRIFERLVNGKAKSAGA